MANRCWWGMNDPVYQDYHDNVWGKSLRDDRKLFEMLSLQCFHSGLSWLTVLRKQPAFREAFAQWDIQRIATFGEPEIATLLDNKKIIRNRKKIEAVIHNAQLIPSLLETYDRLIDYFEPFAPRDRKVPKGGFTRETLPLMIDEAKALSKDLKTRGFRFTGPMVCMSFMQSVGLINDHVQGCDLCIY